MILLLMLLWRLLLLPIDWTDFLFNFKDGKDLWVLLFNSMKRELPKVARILSKINRTNIRYTFYITKNIGKDIPRCTFIAMNGTSLLYNRCFVINELRNLAIESIQTTHYMIIDSDGIISSRISSFCLFSRNHASKSSGFYSSIIRWKEYSSVSTVSTFTNNFTTMYFWRELFLCVFYIE